MVGGAGLAPLQYGSHIGENCSFGAQALATYTGTVNGSHDAVLFRFVVTTPRQ
jgi:hypothetical protein